MIRRVSVIYAGGGGVDLQEARMRSQGCSQELRNERRRRRNLFTRTSNKSTERECAMIRRVSVRYAGGGGVDLQEPTLRSQGCSQEIHNERRRRWTLFTGR